MHTAIDHIGKYELKAVLARTPSSTVYDGWDSGIARRVAVKLIPLSLVDDGEAADAFTRFKRGAQAAGQLNHPNIVNVFDYGETTEYAYLVMEFVAGVTLKSLLDSKKPFALSEICHILGSVLEALQYSHDRGVVHRDVKPANIMITQSDQVKVADFGIARLEGSDMTQTGTVIGTPAYMSPEQFLGEKIDLRTDIYSTGVVLYQMLTGDRPYEGTLATIMHKVLYGKPLLPSMVATTVTPALDAIVTRAMARRREDRFRGAAEFNAALQAALLAERSPRVAAPSALGVSRSSVAASGSSSRTLMAGALAASVLVVGGFGGWYALSGGTQPAPDRTSEATPPAVSASDAGVASTPAPAAIAPPPPAVVAAPDPVAEVKPADQAIAPPLTHENNPPADEPVTAPPVGTARLAAKAAPQRTPPGRKVASNDLRPGKSAPDSTEHAAGGGDLKTATTEDILGSTLRRLRQEQEGQPAGLLPPTVALTAPYAVTSSSPVGLLCQSVTADNASELGLDSPRGMVVTGVVVGSAAAKAGIREDDVILNIKGVEARDLSVLSRIAANTPAGQTVPLDIVRHGARQVVQLEVDALRH